jgi:Asp-tRNA(Asn)/Glu-tRNA(Gln) amidotransferase A subunit family amidase
MRFMFLGNLIGFPAIVVPTSLGANNLPLSVQVQQRSPAANAAPSRAC